MISITTQETKQSSTCEGVAFTIRKLSRIQRSVRDLSIFEQKLKADELASRWWELKKKSEAPDAPPGPVIEAEMAKIDAEYGLMVNAYVMPAVIRAGLVSITGLEINGKSATPEDIASNATPELDDLVREIYAECEAASGLSAAQRKNSQSPTISNDPAVGEKTDLNAVVASA